MFKLRIIHDLTMCNTFVKIGHCISNHVSIIFQLELFPEYDWGDTPDYLVVPYVPYS